MKSTGVDNPAQGGRARVPGPTPQEAPAQTPLAGPAPLLVPPTDDTNWLLVEEGFVLAREHEIESLFAISNGYLGTRAAMPESVSLSAPATFVSGVFERVHGSFPELLAAPNWTALATWVDGHKLAGNAGSMLELRRTLDLRHGLFWHELRHQDPDGRITRLIGLRLASLADRHVLAQCIAFCPENYSGHVRLESRIELPRRAEELPPPGFQTSGRDAGSEGQGAGPVTLSLHAAGSGVRVAFAGESKISPHSPGGGSREIEADNHQIMERLELQAEIGGWHRLDRIVSVYTSRDTEHPVEAASAHLRHALGEGMHGVVDAHAKAWESRWRTADVEIDGDAAAQRALRFACYHLIGAANPEDERVSIGARALTGTAYKGHVFWDTEIYMLPFFVFTHPTSARALLMYRWHALPAAREKASACGFRGAMYPWESADTGEEVTPATVLDPTGELIAVLNGEQEQHITADVAYGVWQYWQATGDEAFFLDAGAEIMLETARFWASRGRIEDDGLFHIRGVIGPDEYHEHVDDNAYTNLMAQWNLQRGAETAAIFKQRWPERWRELAGRLDVTDEGVSAWPRLAQLMYTGFDPQSRLFEQFRGYFRLEEIDLAAYEPRTVAIDVLLGRARTQRSKVVKQADTLMALYLLWDRFSPEVREANFRYYEPRTGHGSSLSPSIHALLAARLGDLLLADRYFRQAAEIDLTNNMGNAAGGVHAAALGGLWQAVVFGSAGLQVGTNGLSFGPNLPASWGALRFPLQWRGRRLRVNIQRGPLRIDVQLEGDGPVKIEAADGPAVVVQPGRRYCCTRAGAGWGPWEEVRT